MEYNDFLAAAAEVAPSPRQLAWYEMGFYGFIHFGVNTFTGRQWGLGNEPESVFNPKKLDCDNWARAAKEAGMGGLILTAKHHDGFCLWPSKYTEHSVKNSPFRGGQGDVVRELSDACRRAGIKLGIYLSPWDRNSKLYGTPEYNEYYRDQLTELLTGYGELFMVWWDEACGEGANGKRQEYDFPSYIELVRRYQPNAVIFNDHGPDVRWIGNEQGESRPAEWAVVPGELCHRAERQTGPGPRAGALSHIYNTDDDLGQLQNILYSRGLTFCPSECDMSIRRHWFYDKKDAPRPAEYLFDTYLRTVGGNACFNLNVPPTRDGLFSREDSARLRELSGMIRSAFGREIPSATEELPGDGETQPSYEITAGRREHFHFVELREDIVRGQRVESFILEAEGDDGFYKVGGGFTIGHRRICRVDVKTTRFRVHITAARGKVELLPVRLY